MKTHRYNYLYVPVSKFIRRLSPQVQLLLVIGKLALILCLLGFDIIYIGGQI